MVARHLLESLAGVQSVVGHIEERKKK